MSADVNSIVEYLYVDKARLDAYFEQISDPVAYDKVPIWKVALGLTGPKSEATQVRPGRAYTQHEKVIKLVDYLKDKDQLATHRVSDPFHYDKQFTIESMNARRAHIPTRKDVPNFEGLNIWVSEKPKYQPEVELRGWGTGALFLIEDFQCEDDNDSLRRYSGFSSLVLLVDTLEGKIAHPVFQTKDRRDLPDGLSDRFSSDPIGALSSIDAEFGPPRRIRAMYRVRAACVDKGVVTVAYPIAVFDEKGAEKIGT